MREGTKGVMSKGQDDDGNDDDDQQLSTPWIGGSTLFIGDQRLLAKCWSWSWNAPIQQADYHILHKGPKTGSEWMHRNGDS